MRLSDEQLESILQLVNTEKTENNSEILNNFWQLLNWPSECVFPVLDIARLAVLHKKINDELCNDNLMPIIMRHLANDAIAANQMLTFRLLANMFNHERGERLSLMHNDDILNALIQLKTLGSKNNQVNNFFIWFFSRKYCFNVKIVNIIFFSRLLYQRIC